MPAMSSGVESATISGNLHLYLGKAGVCECALLYVFPKNLLALLALGHVLNLWNEVKRPTVSIAHKRASQITPDNTA